MFLKWREHIDRNAGLITYTTKYKDDNIVISATVYPCEHPTNRARRQWTCQATIWTRSNGYDHGLSFSETNSAKPNSASAMEYVEDYIKRLSKIKKSEKSERFIAWLKDDSSKAEIG